MIPSRPLSFSPWRLCALLAAAVLAGCASEPTPPTPTVEEATAIAKQPRAMQPRKPADMKSRIVRFLPRQVQDKPGWANDVVTALSTQGLTVNDHNVCSVLAVAEQEATYQADPVVPGLGKIAWKEINARAAKLLIPEFVVRTALSIKSPTGKSYAARIDALRTEREMSEIFEDMIGAVPMGKQLFGNLNPVRTGGPMQVSVAFAEANARGYPYPVKESIRHEVFTRRGGIWFGTKHIFGYPADYPDTLYRFADFNAGWYASRNAAFQAAVSRVSGKPLALDGDLVRYDSDLPGKTELAVHSIASRVNMSKQAIHQSLLKGDSSDFAQTDLYHRVFTLADKQAGKRQPRAVLPGIQLKSPKITRNLTTAWFAKRVDDREQACVRKMTTIR
ncbi:DUF1615 domain-containing protein [Aeromonas rivipollensis]|uniref:DUF1615 domain-containing protein n=1 Tax=Aeromonas rivipollensis TaxID=948519 RepID=UPI00259E7C89|nr:DUF1615 domain-containing protein [Aeromonas rivipollensis]MDM5084828.1 DUF1615 domain-containing protein [Aeromonas rivipollensis]MDM5096899.1 DUF1615 domain-containing protein [Aeromonas rivipollensis]MDM5105840.1 DUF1615 domain-containing protein [Aeromonas rivipollensis]